MIRRALVAVLTGMAVAAAIRLRVRRRAVPPQTGGWRELRDDELVGDVPQGGEPDGEGELAGGERSGTEPTGDETSAERG